MNDALIGVLGGAVGVIGTLAGTIYTQRRAELSRAEDRKAEAARWLAERQERVQQWNRERAFEIARDNAQAWAEDRKRVYLEMMRAASAWILGFVSTVGEYEGRASTLAKYGDRLPKETAVHLRDEGPDLAPLDSHLKTLTALETEVLILAQNDLLIKALRDFIEVGKGEMRTLKDALARRTPEVLNTLGASAELPYTRLLAATKLELRTWLEPPTSGSR